METTIVMKSLEEGVLRVLYEAPATTYECAAGLLHFGYAQEVVTDEVEALLGDLERRACVIRNVDRTHRRYTITPAGSERLAVLVEAA
jgi:DNA-binding PadR family transcriptional regulator